ncbi:pyridoxamine 5'-phosphate oxidase family protein [Streptomyces seoulensis]
MDGEEGARVLERHECLSLLATTPVGRVVHTRHALPAVLLVDFVVDHDGAVLARTSAEPARAIDGAVVAFEADAVDPVSHSGWSVVITGSASVTTGRGARPPRPHSGPRPGAAAPGEVFIRIEPELVYGREVREAEADPFFRL